MQDFVSITREGKTALVHPEYRDTVADALLEGKGCMPAGLGGRTELLRFEYEGGSALLRPYRRGGLVRHVLKDAYWLVNRPLRELRIHRRVHEAGLSVPLPLGVCWTRRGLLYRGCIATHEVHGGDLLDFLKGEAVNGEEVLRGCGASIRAMHDAGVYHADLQVRNLVMAEGRNYLIDFDNARLKSSLTRVQRARNLIRLRRSMEKNGVLPQYFTWLCDGYGVEGLPGWR